MLLLAQPILAMATIASGSPKTLAIILVGHDPASELYVAIKSRKAADYGVNVKVIRLNPSITTKKIVTAVHQLNAEASINAIIVQLPLPEGINTDPVLNAIDLKKDVDNLTGASHFKSPMVQAVESLAKHYGINFDNKKVCVVGHGRLIGQPITNWLNDHFIEPIILASETEFDCARVRKCDIVIAGTGVPGLISKNCVRPGQVIFDCSGKDVDFAAVKDIVAALTPPKGGIGPLTVHFLLTNVLSTATP